MPWPYKGSDIGSIILSPGLTQLGMTNSKKRTVHRGINLTISLLPVLFNSWFYICFLQMFEARSLFFWRERCLTKVSSKSTIGTFCKPKFGNFDGNGPRPGEKCETNCAFSRTSIRTFGWRALEPNKIFGSVQAGRFESAHVPCGHAL